MEDLEKEQLKRDVAKLQQDMKKFMEDYAKHNHDDVDGTRRLRKTIDIDDDQALGVGNGTMASPPIRSLGASTEQVQYSIAVGKDDGRSGFVNKADLLQLNFLHQPRNASLQSFINAFRTPVVTSLGGTSISTTSGGNTVTIAGFGFASNELAGALIDIFNSSGALVETQVIASNTATVITITGTWLASTSGATFQIYSPVFFGSAETIFQRFYTQEGTAGGIRFGVGVTAGGQNGLLYSDATGDLYWRNKSGVSTKLN